MSASLSGFAMRNQCATSTVFSRTEQPCACMLTVLMERESTPCKFAITSEARHGSSCAGVLVAATSRPTRRGSPPHSSMQRRAARTPISVEELVAYIGSPPRNSGRFSSVENLRSTPRLETVLMSSGESLYIMAAINSVVLTAFGGVEVAEAMRLIISTPVGSVGGRRRAGRLSYLSGETRREILAPVVKKKIKRVVGACPSTQLTRQ